MCLRFDTFDISPDSIKALHTVLKYETMTQVQEATFPVILQGTSALCDQKEVRNMFHSNL